MSGMSGTPSSGRDFRKLEDAECVLDNDEKDVHSRGRAVPGSRASKAADFHTPVVMKKSTSLSSSRTGQPGAIVVPQLSLEVDVVYL